MPVFPQVGPNLVLTQRPYTTRLSYRTEVNDMESGRRYSLKLFGAGFDNYPTGPLSRFTVNYPCITDDEVTVLETFFHSVKGRYGSFIFLDPGGNLLIESEDLSAASWTKSGATIGAWAADPFSGLRARPISGGSVSASVCPDGGVAGYVFCFSVWLKAAAPTTVTLTFDSTAKTFAIGTSWVRRCISKVAVGDGPIVASVAGAVSLFGAQVSPMLGEGGYMKSPGNCGYHKNCRLDTDEFTVTKLGPNQNSLQLPVAEYFA